MIVHDNDHDDSCSKSIIETVNGSHDFTIKGYSLAKGMGVGKYIPSDTFKVGGYDWAIYFYPDGKNVEDSPAYVSAFIALAGEGTDVRALFQLTLFDQSGKGKHKVHSHFDRALESGPYALKYRGSMWGYKRFLKRSILDSSNFIKDDCLALRCTVGVVRTRVVGPKQYFIPVPPSNMGQDLKYLLESEVGCDIFFEVGEEKFKAHKLILASRSPVFRAQFYGLIGDPNLDKLVLQDLEPWIFKAMLLFIYSDKFPDVQEIMGSTSVVTSTIMLQHLLAAADRFGLDRLKMLCEEKLCEELSVETVATTLPLAEQHHCPQLKAICLKFAASNLGDKFPDVQEIMGSTSVVTSTTMLQHLLAAANRFGLDRLKMLCEEKLCEELSVETVATTLPLAEQHHCPQLKAICLKFAASNLGVVMRSEGFGYLEKSFPSLLSQLLEAVAAAVDESSSPLLNRKRSATSSVCGLDLAGEGAAAAESANPAVKRMRKRF